jgi:hypothetical protein
MGRFIFTAFDSWADGGAHRLAQVHRGSSEHRGDSGAGRRTTAKERDGDHQKADEGD